MDKDVVEPGYPASWYPPPEMQREAGREAEILAAARRLDRLREIRPSPRFSPTIADDARRVGAMASRSFKDMGAVAEAWADLVPGRLRERCRLMRLQRGVLEVAAGDAAGRYEFDRWMRGGGLAALRDAATAPINRVRVTIDSAQFEAAN